MMIGRGEYDKRVSKNRPVLAVSRAGMVIPKQTFLRLRGIVQYPIITLLYCYYSILLLIPCLLIYIFFPPLPSTSLIESLCFTSLCRLQRTYIRKLSIHRSLSPIESTHFQSKQQQQQQQQQQRE